MDANWRPTQGSGPAPAACGVDPNTPAGGDWRLQPVARSRVVNKILETLKKHMLASVPEELNELQKIAVRLEEKIYSVATNQSDYLRKISLKMLSMEMETQQAPGNAQVIPNQNSPGQASEESTAQTGHAGAGDWQEETYQMIRSLKDQHFAELNELFNKISVKLQHVDSIIPCQVPSEQYERMKSFKIMLDRILQMLLISKSTIQPALRDKVPQYEKQIISILSSKRRFQPPTGQAPNSNISQQQQPSQSLQQHASHTNPQASLSARLQSSSAAAAGLQHVTGSKNRSSWTDGQTEMLVVMMKEYADASQYHRQNGWTKEGWNFMAARLNKQFTRDNFTAKQVKYRAQRLKREYAIVKSILDRSGFGWDPEKKVPKSIGEKWDELSQEQRKWRFKEFPHYDDLHGIYEGKTIQGKRCKSTTDVLEEKYNSRTFVPHEETFTEQVLRASRLNSPSPTLEAQGLGDGDYGRDRDEKYKLPEAPLIKKAKHSKGSDEGKRKKGKDVAIDNLVAVKKEELETYKDVKTEQTECYRDI